MVNIFGNQLYLQQARFADRRGSGSSGGTRGIVNGVPPHACYDREKDTVAVATTSDS